MLFRSERLQATLELYVGARTDEALRDALRPVFTKHRSAFLGAARIAKRVVLGFGAYALGVFGAKYSNVQDLYGEAGADGDFEVTFVSGEAAVGVGIKVAPSPDLGVTLRVPFAWQRGADDRRRAPHPIL